jgi:hypothetical protein
VNGGQRLDVILDQVDIQSPEEKGLKIRTVEGIGADRLLTESVSVSRTRA